METTIKIQIDLPESFSNLIDHKLIDLKETGVRGHFSQILEDQYGYKVLHFAHGGWSNAGILFQIQEAVKHQPDVIVYNKTWASRVTIKLKEGFISNLFLSILSRNLKSDKNIAKAIKDADESIETARETIEKRFGGDKEAVKKAIPQSVRKYLGFDY